MLELDINEAKTLEFEVQIQGIGYNNLKGSLRFTIGGVEYGFPATVTETTVLIDIPPLSKVIKSGLKDGERASCKLEMWGDGFYMKPWGEEEITFKVPIQVEAKIRDLTPATQKAKPKVEIKSIETPGSKVNKIVEGKEREDFLDRKIGEKLDSMRKITGGKRPKTKDITALVVEKGKHKPTTEIKQNLTKDDVFGLMESRGMKNSKIQNAILEKLGYDGTEENFSGLYNQVKDFLDGKNLDLPTQLPKLRGGEE